MLRRATHLFGNSIDSHIFLLKDTEIKGVFQNVETPLLH